MTCAFPNRRRFVLGAGAALIELPARADLYEDYLNSTSRQPFIAFFARRGIPGHAFVGVGVQLDAGLSVYERFFGYYPAAGDKTAEVKLVLGKKKGVLDYKWADTAWSSSYRVNVDDARKAAALAVVDKWKSSDPKYNLFAIGGKNCSVFAAEVAAAAGLKAPPGAGSMLPADYIAKLKQANSK